MKKLIYSGLLLFAAALGGCQADMDTPDLKVPVATETANTSILELKEAFEGKTELIGYKPGTERLDDDGNVIDGEHYIIKGRVVSSDASGNIYKSLVLQDETAALAFSLNQSSMYVDNPLGQEVVIDVTGLYIGYYRGLQQIGSPGEPYRGTPQLGFMPYSKWQQRAQLDGLPDTECQYIHYGETPEPGKMYCYVFNSFDELDGKPLAPLQSQLVEFRNVSFKGAGELNFSDYQESANRELIDADGGTNLTVRNSGYSNFYADILPVGRGKVRGILSYYGDSWQLVLRSRSDVMITENGSEEKPFTIADVQNPDNEGMAGWVEGFIVGSVKAGVQNVASASDIIFGPAAEMDNNLVVAAKADETDPANCIVVNLPQNSVFRNFGNLATNPSNYKKAIRVDGTIGMLYGMHGIVSCDGTSRCFRIDGVDPDAPAEKPAAKGSGTEADPYNIGFVMRSESDFTDVWVSGYVVGYVAGKDWDTAEFSANAVQGSSNWLNSTNVILSENPAGNAGKDNSIPAGLTSAVRPTLGIKNNPAIFGKKVLVKCNVTEYFGQRGIRNITEVKIVD